MNVTRKILYAALISATAVTSLVDVRADDKAMAVKATPVATGLDNPSGVAIQPKTGHVLIASRPGVFRLVPGKPGKVTAEINGYATDIYGKGPKYNIGPLGVAFLNDDHLIVSDGSLPDASEVVQIFKVGPTALEAPVSNKTAAYTLGPIKGGEESAKGEGNFYAIAVGEKAFYITSNGDDTKGWILKVDVADGKPGDLKPFIATKKAVNVDAPVGITMSPDGKQIVVGQMGEISVPGDSLLSFYDPQDGKLLKNFKTGLNDIDGLAYSPKTGKLYAVDFSWSKPTDGGLFRLDIDGDQVKTTKILSLDKPTSLAFDKEGALYLTVFGTAAEGAKTAPGAVLKVGAGL